jgi:hypothetical protein
MWDLSLTSLFLVLRHPPCSLGLSATSQQYFSLRTNQPPATSQQYFSLRTNQHQPSATSQTNRVIDFIHSYTQVLCTVWLPDVGKIPWAIEPMFIEILKCHSVNRPVAHPAYLEADHLRAQMEQHISGKFLRSASRCISSSSMYFQTCKLFIQLPITDHETTTEQNC